MQQQQQQRSYAIGHLSALKGIVRAKVWTTYAVHRRSDVTKETTIIERAFNQAFLAPHDADVLMKIVQAGPGRCRTALIGSNGHQLLRLCGIGVLLHGAPKDYPDIIYRALTDTSGAAAADHQQDPDLRWWITEAVRWSNDVDGIYQQYQLACALNYYVSFRTKPPVMPRVFSTSFHIPHTQLWARHRMFSIGVLKSFQHLRPPGSLCEYVCILYLRIMHINANTRTKDIQLIDTVDLTCLKSEWTRKHPAVWRYLEDVRLIYQCAREYIDYMVSPERRIVTEPRTSHNVGCTRSRNQGDDDDGGGVINLKRSGIRDDFGKWLTRNKKMHALEVMETSTPFCSAISRSPSFWPVFACLIWTMVCNGYGYHSSSSSIMAMAKTWNRVVLPVKKIKRSNNP